MRNKQNISRRLVGRLLASMPFAIMGTGTVVAAPWAAQVEPKKALLPEDALACLEIERLLYRYAAAIDNLDAGALQSCFAVNGVLVLSATKTLTGDFAAGMFERGHSKLTCTMHNVQNHLYTVRDNTARGWTYCVASHIKKQQDEYINEDYYIHYDDQLTKGSDGRWLFTERRLHTLFIATAPVKNVSPPEGRARGQSY